ncbi:MAG: hypothetical protein ACI4PM_02215 [Butyricicoccus sp.]
MREFISSALPWVMMGIALAVWAVSHSIETQKDEKRGERIAMGASFGLLLGVALNSCGLWENHAIGFALGPLWGMALASLFRGRGESEEEDSDKR